MQNIFNTTMFVKPKSNNFKLKHDFVFSGKMGQLIPTCVMECIPGDKIRCQVQNFGRFMPMLAPIMHKVDVYTHFFFVPNRLSWREFPDWISGNIQVEPPQISVYSNAQGTVADYMGIPVGSLGGGSQTLISAFPFAAYTRIYNEFYRDQNLIDKLPDELLPGATNSDFNRWFDADEGKPLLRAWEHDYYTACLPFAQKGDEAQLPLTIQADIPVNFQQIEPGENPPAWRNPFNGLDTPAGNISGETGTVDTEVRANTSTRTAYDPMGTLSVDVQSDAATINDLRSAFALQSFLEKSARAGTRFYEWIKGIYGVQSSDARLDRPEYIYGYKQNLTVSEVLATAENTEADVAVGTMAGHALTAGGTNSFNYFVEEHGYFIGITSVRPKSSYMQGIHKHFQRFNRTDYAIPDFANLGEQAVLLREVNGLVLNGETTFGYIPRYSEYKYMPNRVAGEMRSDLNFWHLARIFDGAPALNQQFIECNPADLTRIFAVTDPSEDHLLMHVINDIRVNRRLPRYGIPATLR